MTTGSVADAQRSGRTATTSALDIVQAVQKMFRRSLGKSSRQAARESELTRYTVRTALKKKLKWQAWKTNYCQLLSAED